VNLTAKTTSPAAEKLDLLAVLLWENERPDAELDEATGGAARRAVKSGDFEGKLRQQALLYGAGKAARVLLVGLGPKRSGGLEPIRRAAGTAAAEAVRLRAGKVGLVAPATRPRGVDAEAAAFACASAARMACYGFDRHKGRGTSGAERERKVPTSITLFGAERPPRQVLERARAVADGVDLARDLANEPGNYGTPTAIAEAAKRAGRRHGFKVKVLGPDDMRRLGMGALLGVAKGSEEPPRLIQMEYGPPKGPKARGGTVCLVGKGLTFDAGGISLKPADKMWEMKFDKCGGCAVIGAMAAIAAAKLPIKVVGLVPSSENLPDGRANKPGDVLVAMNGKTIEVLNTDAEGRLILADALAYSERFSPDLIVDMATLTGSCVVALGDVRAAVLSPDEDLVTEVRRAGDAAGELVWPLPMDDAYGEHVKSEVADVKNLGKGREAGTIAGGWFLRNFVPEGIPWAHLDIAGTAWHTADPGRGYLGKGASGFGVRLCWELVRRRAEEERS